ncbi:MAG: type IV pilus modification protein PilV [Thiomonas sp. 20-64-9]|jgi:type IV pilus assembly protein PilV|uniref:type IV pilus modification protein PilV n=1 Tax=unclassified Thiomonas TaxID=2625466 RepID=UPI000ABA9E8E|nr:MULTISPECIES: type IV pilus modification protein PilV [unclassified Thiomonas]OYV31371.1 MAG: type IV pilus modification protein PilV [Thiomonas sp. 20-64-9]OZB69317.1 MAG: type IV pilus modification protein PilV [Thiomonas sp. 13-64-67]
MRNPTLANSKSAPFEKGHQSQVGAGLLEILIAVLVLSIGFLGMSTLLVRSMTNNNSAMAHTQTSVVTYAILDSLRANRTAALNGDYDTTATFKLTGSTPSCSLSTNLTGRPDTEVQAWCLGSGGTPPGGLAALGNGATGKIDCNSNGDCTVTVTFDDSRATAGSSTQTFVTKAML